MASFNAKFQKLVIGSVQGQLIVYSLRTVSRWRVYDGHQGPVSSVEFSPDGMLMCSFSAVESAVRWWQVCYVLLRTLSLSAFEHHVHASALVGTRLTWRPIVWRLRLRPQACLAC